MRDAKNVLRTLEILSGHRLVALYDSLSPAGESEYPSREPGSRRLLFRAAGTCLELHLEPRPEKQRTRLEGQLSNLCDPLQTISSAPVVVTAGGLPRTVVWSNRHGSFDLLIAASPETCLWIGVEEQRLELLLDPWILG